MTQKDNDSSKRPTIEDARRYCPLNNKCRGDDQSPLINDEYENDLCLMDHERCHFSMCSTLVEILKAESSKQDLPDTCKECGGNCSKTERSICLAELDGVA